jgi:hypothetical protein
VDGAARGRESTRYLSWRSYLVLGSATAAAAAMAAEAPRLLVSGRGIKRGAQVLLPNEEGTEGYLFAFITAGRGSPTQPNFSIFWPGELVCWITKVNSLSHICMSFF